MKAHRKLMASCITAALIHTAAAAEERTFTLLERELEYLVSIWPGDYDNREQLAFDASVGKKDMDSGGHLRVHSQIRRVDVPALGAYVLYVEEYKTMTLVLFFASGSTSCRRTRAKRPSA